MAELNTCSCCGGFHETPVPKSTTAHKLKFNRLPGRHTLGNLKPPHAFLFPGQPSLRILPYPGETTISAPCWMPRSLATADVLTFTGKELPNESYLRTATGRLSVLQTAVIGCMNSRPGVLRQLHTSRLPLEDTPPPLGPIMATNNSEAIREASSSYYQRNFKVQSIPGPDEKPRF